MAQLEWQTLAEITPSLARRALGVWPRNPPFLRWHRQGDITRLSGVTEPSLSRMVPLSYCFTLLKNKNYYTHMLVFKLTDNCTGVRKRGLI